jgi:hypothetical protein
LESKGSSRRSSVFAHPSIPRNPTKKNAIPEK